MNSNIGTLPAMDDYVTPRLAAKHILRNLSVRRVQKMCEERVFKTAHKPGSGPNAHWKILRSEVIAHKVNSHQQ